MEGIERSLSVRIYDFIYYSWPILLLAIIFFVGGGYLFLYHWKIPINLFTSSPYQGF